MNGGHTCKAMTTELTIEILAWGISIILLILLVPKNKFREAQVIFLFKQLITWVFGLATVELRLIEYPIRLFSYANKASFTFEFFVYPTICVIFSLYYPEKKGHVRIFLHYFYFCTVLTIIEVLLEKYTDLIKYINWNWFITWITLFITFYLTRKYYVWFFNAKTKSFKIL